MRTKAFTLIELLVVIAIIGMLLAILVPSLLAVKEIASLANCLTNQKNIALAYTSYCMDNDDKLCSGYVYDDMNVREVPSWVRAPLVFIPGGGYILAADAQLNTETRLNGLREGAIFPYIESTDVFHCPGDKRIKFGASRHMTDNPPDPINVYQAYRSYGMPDFYQVNGSGNEKQLGNVSSPGSKLLFVEDQYDKYYNIDSWSYQPGLRMYWDPLGNYHNKSCTFAFADGHSEQYKWKDPRSDLFMSDRVAAAAKGCGKDAPQTNPYNADHDWLDSHYPCKTRFLDGQ